jgi:hypothetical protein
MSLAHFVGVLSSSPNILAPDPTRVMKNQVAGNHAILSTASSSPAGGALLSSYHLSVMDDVDHREFEEHVYLWDSTLPWTPKQIQLYSSLPVDIVRIIFEKVMEDEPPPVHLLRVSHQVRRW